VNELELIRNQLRAERDRALDLARVCAAPGASAELRQAAVEYLAFVLTRFDERDQRLAEQYRTRLLASDPKRQALEQILAHRGASREALAKLEAALGAPTATQPHDWAAFGEFLEGPWRDRREALDAVQRENTRIADWRAVSFVDADSIVEERSLYARVQSRLARSGALRA
jgi:hypothetical protein